MRVGFGKWSIDIDWLALVCVIIPTTAAALYFGIFASDVYISESRFVVRAPDKPAATGLGLVLKSIGFSNSGDELFATREFVMSRDALTALNKDRAFEKAYSNPTISMFDRFDPFGLKGSFEDLYDYYSGKVTITQDSSTAVAVLTVRAFTPRDAFKFNSQLLGMAELTVNHMNERGRRDLVTYAQREVDVAKDQSWKASVALAAYRNKHKLADPEEQGAVTLQLVSKLQDDLVASQAQLAQLRAFTPQNPQIPVLENRVQNISTEIGNEISKIAGNSNSLAATSVEYQRLQLESQFADKQLAAAMASFEQAKSEASRQQAYVETIVSPNQPDSALEPRRLRGVFTTLILGLVAWGISRMLIAGLMEHRE